MVKCALLAVFLATAGISFAEAPVGTEAFSVPAGTLLHCRTNQTLTTKLNKQGDAFTINIAEPVSVNGHVVIPVGSSIFGRIMLMERPRPHCGRWPDAAHRAANYASRWPHLPPCRDLGDGLRRRKREGGERRACQRAEFTRSGF